MATALDDDYFCGCCGNPCRRSLFCARCTSSPKHLGPSDRHAWDRTYFAMNGVDCPFSTVAAESEKPQ